MADRGSAKTVDSMVTASDLMQSNTHRPMIQVEQDHGSGNTGRPITVRDESSEDVSVDMEDASNLNNLDITQG